MNMIAYIQSWISAKAKNEGERGAGLAEYALLLVLIAVACITAMTALSGAIQGAYGQITAAL